MLQVTAGAAGKQDKAILVEAEPSISPPKIANLLYLYWAERVSTMTLQMKLECSVSIGFSRWIFATQHTKVCDRTDAAPWKARRCTYIIFHFLNKPRRISIAGEAMITQYLDSSDT